MCKDESRIVVVGQASPSRDAGSSDLARMLADIEERRAEMRELLERAAKTQTVMVLLVSLLAGILFLLHAQSLSLFDKPQ